MRQHHNVLYVTSKNAYLHKRDVAVEIVREDCAPTRIPVHHLQGIVCFGPVTVSPWLMEFCAKEGIAISFFTEQGRFLGRVVGPQQGNVMLRRAQYRAADDPQKTLEIARAFVLGKVANCKTLIRRGSREVDDDEAAKALCSSADQLATFIEKVRRCEDIESLRGLEGISAKTYFSCFPYLLRGDSCFTWNGRSSRPPRDPTNTALSFLYSMLTSDCSGALQAVGLDPEVGYLHVEKSGRPALALDLMEEFRPIVVDRMLFALVNRMQLKQCDFIREESGAYQLSDDGRKKILTQYQERKREEIRHPFLGETTQYGLLFLLQARLLSRYLRCDLDGYPPFLLV